MLPIHTILHPTDFSERSQEALQMACGLARDYGARLILLHVAMPPTLVYAGGVLPPESDELLARSREQLLQLIVPDAGINIERRFVEGDPATAILEQAEAGQVDLIVMGTHGRTGLGRLFMGSVAEEVARRAPCPVLTMTNPFPARIPAGEAQETPTEELPLAEAFT